MGLLDDESVREERGALPFVPIVRLSHLRDSAKAARGGTRQARTDHTTLRKEKGYALKKY